MKKNLYFQDVFKRENTLKNNVLDFFLALASYPRLLIEVFTRRNMGERYFSFASAMTIFILMLVFPFIIYEIVSFFANPLGSLTHAGGGLFGRKETYGNDASGKDIAMVSVQYLTWYPFAVIFFVCALARDEEVKRNPSVFDFERFSLSTGQINPYFLKRNIFGGPYQIRTIETLVEPAPFFFCGIVLWLCGQSLGWLLVLASICYAASYAGAYRRGDDFIMDRIDEMILNEKQIEAFVDGLPPEQTKGVRFYSKRPTSEELRLKIAKSFSDDEDDGFVMD